MNAREIQDLERFRRYLCTGFYPGSIADKLDDYLATDTIASSVWFYRGLLDETQGKSFPGHIDVPTAVADYPKDLLNGRPPKSLIAFGYNLVRYTRMPRGGHFAALEQPDLFCQDVSDFFHSLPETRF
jgi:hypothetical protein